MNVKELKSLLDTLPDDAEVKINSIYNEAGECESLPIVKAVYQTENNTLSLTPELILTVLSLGDHARINLDSVVSVKAVDIEWDTDGGDMRALCLSTEMEIPLDVAITDGEIDEDAIGDYISNESGFCHYGFVIEVDSIETKTI